MDKCGRWIAILLLTAPLGCERRIARPYWFHPGTEGYQQARAQRFDPYSDVDISNDSNRVDGLRPRDYSRPASEVKRLQTNADAALRDVPAAMPVE